MFNLDALEMMRTVEIDRIVAYFPPGARVLEIGAGTGQQAAAISRRGFSIEAIELPSSRYGAVRDFPITDYDGRHIPFPDASFDVVFSSNVLEHVPDLAQLNAEIRRVLKPDGLCIHVMPTHGWRFWTTLTSLPACLQYVLAPPKSALPQDADAARPSSRFQQLRRHFGRHGAHGNVAAELWLFHPARWRQVFKAYGYEIVADRPIGIFYTGNTIFGKTVPIAWRERLARFLGSACHIYVVKPARRPD